MTDNLKTKVSIPAGKVGDHTTKYVDVTLGSVSAAIFAEKVFESCLPEGSTSRRILDATGATAALKDALFGSFIRVDGELEAVEEDE